MTTVFQQAAQFIALALGMGFLNEFASIGAFEPVQDLIWKLLMSLAFVYLATRVPSMLGQAGTFDAWLSTLYFGMSLPGSLMRSSFMGGLTASMYLFAVSRRMPTSRAPPRIDNPCASPSEQRSTLPSEVEWAF